MAEAAEAWPRVLPEGFTFYLLDLPGHGRTPGPSMAPEELAEYVAGFLVMTNLGSPPILVRGVRGGGGKGAGGTGLPGVPWIHLRRRLAPGD